MPSFFTVLQALWLFLPAYLANMTPPVAAKILPRWDAPIDGGRVHRDGRPLLGKSKTWRGLVTGGLVGSIVAMAQSLAPSTDLGLDDFHAGETGTLLAPLVLGLFLGLGAGVGDAAKSYLKRRTGREGGAPWFPFDQLDFVVVGLLFAALGATLVWPLETEAHWFADHFILGDGWFRLITLVVLTPLLHFLVNVIAYWLGFKKVPW
jgi:CDP-2,3-bis-(O-geranylgeranyl)-sn-glycerol synthase